MPSTPASNGMTPPRRGGQNKVTPSAARPQERARGTSLSEGGTGMTETPAITPSDLSWDSTTPPSCLWQATVSAAQGKRRLGQEISPQWEISKLANGQRHTVALTRKHLLAPYTGGGYIEETPAEGDYYKVKLCVSQRLKWSFSEEFS